ncbi:DUF4192 domain-containing protein [Streptomyces armeniacus]|uniref:DUF4192 domain-containing protein n=1 Tax=Streptomyces armeniacus TaxID=83291 RepID=A0A345XP24_9ACTN|nr:DUF4192 domain-containing protein [Streptomyces armeniacus]AXK33390.1 DUF4192 domain-containing protein [Streptomyces armeniacus]
MTQHGSSKPSPDHLLSETHRPRISLRSPGELADALPYLLGFQPDDSIVVVALHGERGRFGGRLRIGIPTAPDEWPAVADQLAACLKGNSVARGAAPEGALLFLCQDPADGESGRAVTERLRPLAQRLRVACGGLEMPVYEALCISDKRYWSYCCPDAACCPAEGKPLSPPGTSAMAAAAAFAGIQVRGTQKEMEARLKPLGEPFATPQECALDKAAAALMPRMLNTAGRDALAGETLRLARRLMERLHAASAADGSVGQTAADAQDDALLSHEEAATLILGLQDHRTRDQAAEWMEGRDAATALRLWRALCRRCVGAYDEHAVATLSLAGWIAWSTGDEPAARVALGRALQTDPDCVFAQLMHRACNEGLDPEPLRRCMRQERAVRRRKRRRRTRGTRRTVPRAPYGGG